MTAAGPPTELSARLRAVLALDPTAPALQFAGSWTTWGQLSASIDRLDALLTGAGLGEAASVGIVLRNRPETLAALLGVVATRRAVVTLDPMQPDGVLAADIERLRLPVVVAGARDWQREAVATAAATSGTMGIVVARQPAEVAQPVPGLRGPGPGRHHGARPGVAVEMLTSGTTGPAKRVPLPYARIEASIAAVSHYQRGGTAGLSLKREVGILWSPLVHISGLWHAITSACEGRKIALMERFDVEQWAALVREHRPKLVGLPPAAIRMVLDAKVPKEDLASLRAVRVGTAPLTTTLADEFEATYEIPLLIVYGATELAGAVAGWTLADYEAFGAAKRGSVGRAHPGIALRVVDPEQGQEVETGSVGVLEVHGPQVGDRWVRTTDLARRDDDGFWWIEGRADDVIIRGGFKVSTSLVADTLRLHPAVRDAGVVGVADERLGQVPVAAVELIEPVENGEPAPTAADLEAWLLERLTPYQVPTTVKIVDALPRTDSLKVSQPKVRELFTGAPEPWRG